MTRSIVLVTIDSLRADHCGYWGYNQHTTPTLDTMAEEGLVFENAIAPGPATPESMPVIMTGNYPVARGDGEKADAELVRYRHRIRNHMSVRETIAERFSRAGYATAAFTPNPFTSRHFAFDQGFDTFEDFMDSRPGSSLYNKVFQRFLSGNGVASVGRALINRLIREEVFKPWESFYDEAVDWARQQKGPYFLWLFLMDVHNPYIASREYRTQSRFDSFRANIAFWQQSHETPFSSSIHEKLVRAYDDAIRYTDACVDRLRDDLNDPLFVVHSDHGEAFGEHGFYGHEPYLYEENIHVPLIVDNGPHGCIRSPTELRNLPDMLIDLRRGDFPSSDPQPLAIARTLKGGTTAARGTNWKYIGDSQRGALFDLSQGETTDRSDEFPSIAATGRRAIAQETESINEYSRIATAVEHVDG